MKEYIERSEAERVAMYVAVEKDHAKELIHRIPAADVVEVRHGRWIEKQIPLCWCEDDVDIVYSCSVCGCDNGIGESPYCPNCGAKMDKEKV